jgi:tRNA(Ile)-lysidine synthase
VRAVAVATSGGRDSTALLHCTLRAAEHLGLRVVALHVHHGLQTSADDWLVQVRRQARRWGAGFDCRRIAASPPDGESVEAWARRVRYAALTEMAQGAGCDLVLLAHHRRDQAETWLLQALRGGGALGLSAMPQQIERGGIAWCRPWLAEPREAIENYVRRHRLQVVEDPSNADPRYARNRLRSAVWPPLLMAFPQAESALAAAAAQAQAAASLAAEVLAQDLPLLLDPAGGLHLAQWLALPPARRRNALQGWLRQALGRGAPEALLMRLGEELPGRGAATWDAPGHILRRYRGVLRAVGLAPAAGPSSTPSAGTPAASTPPPFASSAVLDLSRPGMHPMPDWSGSWLIERVKTAGLAPSLLQSARAAPRSGGEHFSLARGAMPRSLKKQFQARGIPAWQRGGPLLFSADGRLMWVPGLGADVRLQAVAGDPQLRVTWVPDPAIATGLRQPAG